MTTTLNLASKLALPLDAVTRTTAIVGQRGTGKTSTAVVMVEEAVAAGAQAAVVDPTGAWFGLRSSANGEKAGLDVVVFGGHHGDIPLEPSAGAFIARLIIDQAISVVLDLELMTKGKQVQFVAELCEELYHRNRRALTVVIDEAHRFAPQQLRDPGGYGARCLGAVTDVVTLGRRKGLGAVLISQRPAKINKDVFEQAEIMVCHRLMGPNDRKAIAGWLDEAIGSEGAEVGTLPGLEPQNAIVWAPNYGVYGRFHIRAKRTFDSSATPEVGATVTEPRGRADVDLAQIEQAMAETIERAKADDPGELRKRIRALERELAQRPAEQVEVEVEVVREVPVEVEILTDDDRDDMRRLAKHLDDMLTRLPEQRPEPVAPKPSAPGRALGRTSAPPVRPARAGASTSPRHAPGDGAGDAALAGPRENLNGTVNAPRQRILDTIAWFEAIGIDAPKRGAVAPLAGTTSTSSGFEKNLSGLRTAGLITYPAGGRLALTSDGRGHAVAPAGTPTSEELQRAVLAKLNTPRRAILTALIDAYPDSLTRDELAERAGTTASSSGFEKNLSSLRTLELIDYPQRGEVAALPVLFIGDM